MNLYHIFMILVAGIQVVQRYGAFAVARTFCDATMTHFWVGLDIDCAGDGEILCKSVEPSQINLIFYKMEKNVVNN